MHIAELGTHCKKSFFFLYCAAVVKMDVLSLPDLIQTFKANEIQHYFQCVTLSESFHWLTLTSHNSLLYNFETTAATLCARSHSSAVVYFHYKSSALSNGLQSTMKSQAMTHKARTDYCNPLS